MAKVNQKTKENFKSMTPAELNKKLSALREEVRLTNFKAEGSRSKNVKELSALRKEIARVLTEINSQRK